LTPLVNRRPGLRIPGAWDAFECAVRAVLGEHVDAATARALAGRLVARAGEPLSEAVDGLTHFFPTPAALLKTDLGGLGLAPSRVPTLRALASATHEGQIDFSAPLEEVLAALTSLPGCDPSAAQYVALCALGEPDAFPRGDLIVRRMAGSQRKPLTSRELDARMEAWRPWRGYALIHLWHAAAEHADALLRRAS
jgi:AraC family transcriptional regulator, regulatory protein of adaptative response / DNA-3-methyladenine glycosylase II